MNAEHLQTVLHGGQQPDQRDPNCRPVGTTKLLPSQVTLVCEVSGSSLPLASPTEEENLICNTAGIRACLTMPHLHQISK